MVESNAKFVKNLERENQKVYAENKKLKMKLRDLYEKLQMCESIIKEKDIQIDIYNYKLKHFEELIAMYQRCRKPNVVDCPVDIAVNNSSDSIRSTDQNLSGENPNAQVDTKQSPIFPLKDYHSVKIRLIGKLKKQQEQIRILSTLVVNKGKRHDSYVNTADPSSTLSSLAMTTLPSIQSMEEKESTAVHALPTPRPRTLRSSDPLNLLSYERGHSGDSDHNYLPTQGNLQSHDTQKINREEAAVPVDDIPRCHKQESDDMRSSLNMQTADSSNSLVWMQSSHADFANNNSCSRPSEMNEKGPSTSSTKQCICCFKSYNELSQLEFEGHVIKCVDAMCDDQASDMTIQETSIEELRTCPICNTMIPQEFSQAVFEEHVLKHFDATDLNFEEIHKQELCEAYPA